MRPFLLVFFFVALFTSANCQDENSDATRAEVDKALAGMLNPNVAVDVDTTLLKKTGPFYLSEDPLVFIMAMVIPQPYEQAVKEMEKKIDEPGAEFGKKEEFVDNGRKFTVLRGTIKKDGKIALVELYATEANATNTIFVTGLCEKKEADKHAFRFRKAALSAKLK